MFEPTGSVYLDTPPTTSRHPVPEPATTRNQRSVAAAILGVIGILALTLAAILGSAWVLVNDTETLSNTIDTVIDDTQIRTDLEAEIAIAIQETLFDTELTAQAARLGLDIETEVATLAPTILDDTTFRAALSDLIFKAHSQVLLDRSDAPIDVAPITSAALAVIEREVPEAASVLSAGDVLFVVTPEQIPDLTGPVGLLNRSLLALGFASLALPLAAVVHPRRHRVMAWAGRWLLVMGLVAACLAVGLPFIAEKLTGSPIVEASIRALSGRLLAPATVAGVAGMGFTAVAVVHKRRETRSAADEGTAAALGFDEPDRPGALPASPQTEFAQRGLVDASQPLTNI